MCNSPSLSSGSLCLWHVTHWLGSHERSLPDWVAGHPQILSCMKHTWSFRVGPAVPGPILRLFAVEWQITSTASTLLHRCWVCQAAKHQGCQQWLSSRAAGGAPGRGSPGPAAQGGPAQGSHRRRSSGLLADFDSAGWMQQQSGMWWTVSSDANYWQPGAAAEGRRAVARAYLNSGSDTMMMRPMNTELCWGFNAWPFVPWNQGKSIQCCNLFSK